MKKIIIILFIAINGSMFAQLPCIQPEQGSNVGIINGTKQIALYTTIFQYQLTNFTYSGVIPSIQVSRFDNLTFTTSLPNLRPIDYFTLFQQFLIELLNDQTKFAVGIHQIQFPSCIKFQYDNLNPTSISFQWCEGSDCCIRKYLIDNSGPCNNRRIVELDREDKICPLSVGVQQFSSQNEIENFLLQPLNLWVNSSPPTQYNTICINFCELLSFLESNKLFIK